MYTIAIKSQDDLPEVAERNIEIISDRKAETNVVAFYGPMGAGKTTLIREICAQLGVEDTVTSPTFAIVNQYMGGDGNLINHFDFYRIDKLEEAFDMGYEEYFYSGDLCLVEWPEKIEGLLPEDTLEVRISLTDESDHERIFNVG